MTNYNLRPAEVLQKSLLNVLEKVQQLRGPKGCPWDKEQTHQSLIPYALDEAYELAEVLQEKPMNDFRVKDELGDVLFQVLIHSEIAAEAGRFDFIDIVENLAEKLVRRHPHVFDYNGAVSKEEVLRNWESIKQTERTLRGEKETSPPLFKSPRYFSALQKAQSIGKKTESLQFDWAKPEEVFEKLQEEVQELHEGLLANDKENIEEEMGDLFFVLTQLCRKLNVDAESIATRANEKFIKRFSDMIADQESVEAFTSLSLDEKEKLWVKIKKQNK